MARRLRRLAQRREPGLVLLEGPRVISEAAAAGVPIELLVLREGERLETPAERTVVLTRGLFRALSQTETPQGVMAVGRAGPVSVAEALARARAGGWPLIVLDGVQDPGNVGAIVRTAAAAGAPALVILPGTADPFGTKAVRASAGNLFRVAVGRGEWDDLEGVRGFGADASGRPMDGLRIETAGMLVMGSEGHGLSRGGLDLVSIPIAPGVESLNVAAAAAILIFEIGRRLAA